MSSFRHTHYLAALLFILQGCSWQHSYYAGQSWQQNECNKISEYIEHSRCISKTNTSYDDFRRQSEALKK